MRIAVQNPIFADLSGVNGWMLEFIKKYRPYIYISHPKYFIWALYRWYRHRLNPFSYIDPLRLIFSEKRLNRLADVLICLNGRPYLEQNKPLKNFRGLKIHHVMDYTYFPGESYETLLEGGVDFVLGYNRHDKYCEFFQKKYPEYIGRVISAPFGFAPRFQNNTPFEARINKCIALGSVNSFDDPLHNAPDFKEVNEHFLAKGERFMHKFRRMLVENEEHLKEIMDSKLPHYPQTKDFSYNIVEVFNKYRMFVSCESLQYFPPAKVFEGPSAGCVMVCSTHSCLDDFGFKDGINCIKHKEFDIEDFREKVTYYINNPDKLKRIQEESAKFVRENYNHAAVAEKVFNSIKEIYEKQRAEA